MDSYAINDTKEGLLYLLLSFVINCIPLTKHGTSTSVCHLPVIAWLGQRG